MRADDIRKASEFDQLCSQTTSERKEEQKLCDHFIRSSRQRYHTNALRLKENFLSLMINSKTAYLNSSCLFWKLDPWEDDLRRRRRLIPNLNGIEHDEIIENSSSNGINDDMMTTILKEEYLLKQLKQPKSQNFLQDEEDISQIDEKDLDLEFSGPLRYSTECLLICGTVAIRGTLAITHTALLFDTNEENEDFKNLDPKVSREAFVTSISKNYLFRYILTLITFTENGVLMKFVRYFHENISYKIKHWKYSFRIEVCIKNRI
jgi:hypothetical protein